MNKFKVYIILTIVTALSIIGLCATVVIWEKMHVFVPFIIMLTVTILIFILTLTYYIKVAHFKCPNCKSVFKPKALSVIMAMHTPRKRRLKCPNCNKVSWCKDIFID